MSLPKINDLYRSESIKEQDDLIVLLNQQPKQTWIKEHPYISNYKYIPIERVEFLLKKIFKRYRIEITGQGTAFNGVWVTVRVHYQHPISQEWDYHDGIGASQLQVKKGTSPSDLSNINNGALSMSFPIAKTVALKDACDHFGKLFGSDLNRKDIIVYSQDTTLIEMNQQHPNWSKVCKAVESRTATLSDVESKYKLSEDAKTYLLTI